MRGAKFTAEGVAWLGSRDGVRSRDVGREIDWSSTQGELSGLWQTKEKQTQQKTMKKLIIAGLMLALAASIQAGTIYVDGVNGDDTTGDGSAGAPFKTIQKGVAVATAGDTVQVLPATYVETGQIVINKDLTIQGSGQENTIVKPASDTGSSGDARGWWLVSSCYTFNLSDITLDGSGRLVFQGIRHKGVGSIDNVTFTEMKYQESGPAYNGVAVAALGGCGAVDVTSCKFSQVGRIGLIYFGAGTTGTCSDSSFTGKGDGDWLDYAVELGGGAVATLTGNTIIGNTGVASVDGSSSAGILVTTYFGAGTQATIDDCIIQGCTIGVAVGYDDADTSDVTVQDCSLVGNEYGISQVGTVEVDAVNNWWGTIGGPTYIDPAPGTLATGTGDWIDGLVSFDPWLDEVPSHDNVLYLVPTDASIYIKPGESIVVDMNVANLQQLVNACQAFLGYSSTYFADPTGATVAPGGSIWDQVIWDSWVDSTGVPGEIDTAIGVNANGAVGTQDDGTVAIITLTSRTGVEGVTQMVFRPDADPDPGLVESTYLSDMAAQPVWPAKVNSANIYIDGTAPIIGTITATQDQPWGGGDDVDVKDCANTAYQGTVNITVDASDALAGLDGQPTVELTSPILATVSATYVDESPEGTFNYTWVVGTTTENGTWEVKVTAKDKAGHQVESFFDICVNKNLVTGQVELEAFVGASRPVTFVATGGTATKSWTLTLGFAAGVASYALTDVPDGTTGISAKAAWNLREKLAVMLADGQATADFLSDGTAGWSDSTDHYLRGGDLNGSNSINVLDYSILKVKWLTADPQADVDGNGVVNTDDYNLMKRNWFKVGDLQ